MIFFITYSSPIGPYLSLEIEYPIDKIDMDSFDINRILGILLDNAIEAATSTHDKILKIIILSTQDRIVFIILNSTLPLNVPLTRLMEKGFTTKSGHDGLGLYTLCNIINSLENVTFSYEYKDIFRQTLIIRKVK